MKPLPIPISTSMMRLLTFTIAITSLTTLLGCTFVHSQDTVTRENENDQTDPPAESYWTPERLKDAKPIEMPSPASPAPQTPDQSTPTPSVDAPGHSGDEDILPDETNQLFDDTPMTKP